MPQRIGSSSSAATAVATDAQGNAYVTGWGQGSGHCGAAAAGPPGFVLAKLRTGPEVLPATESAPLSAYPNPVSEPSFDLFLQGTAEGWGELQLISAQGQLVRTQAAYLSPGVVQAPFDRRGLAPGRYTLRLTQGARVSTTQLLLQ